MLDDNSSDATEIPALYVLEMAKSINRIPVEKPERPIYMHNCTSKLACEIDRRFVLEGVYRRVHTKKAKDRRPSILQEIEKTQI
jgi:hypothetical protein